MCVCVGGGGLVVLSVSLVIVSLSTWVSKKSSVIVSSSRLSSENEKISVSMVLYDSEKGSCRFRDRK